MTTTTKDTATLRELLEDAAALLSTYRNPDIDEAAKRVSAVLEAAGFGTLAGERITRVFESDGFVIYTDWSACGGGSSIYRLPTAVVDAPDPIQAAREHKHANAVRDAEGDVRRAQTTLDNAKKRLATLKANESPNKEP